MVCDTDYESQLRADIPVLISPERQVIVNPLSQVPTAWSKSVGLIGSKNALIQVFVEKNFYFPGEIANISVHIDNTQVKEACSMEVKHITKIKQMIKSRKFSTTRTNTE